MVFTQTTSQLPVHLNSLYHEWGLVAMVVGFCIALISGLWWLLRLDSSKTTEAALKVRSVLAGMFQQTIVNEAVRIFRIVDDHLPYSLSQADIVNARPSAFDRLCEGLRSLSEKDTDGVDRNDYRVLLESALSGVIVREVQKLLEIVEANAMGDPSEHPNPTRLRISLEGNTEHRLSFIAKKTVASNKMERCFHRAKWCAFCCFSVAVVCGLLVTPWVFLDYTWAFVISNVFLAVFGVMSLAGIACLVWFHRCQSWLEATASRYNSPDDWFGELSQHRAK